MSFDANGNEGGATYNLENRMVRQYLGYGNPTNTYAYDPSGKRVMSGVSTDTQLSYTYSFYGITGQRLATLKCVGLNARNYPTCDYASQNVYFGGKLIVSGGVNVVTDRLGTVRVNGQGESFAYYPYGEERTSTVDKRDKFGTYFRDSAGQDYADQRYYNAGMGRFWTVDPGGIRTANPSRPSSWNRYSYVRGDPVNRSDPTGLCDVLLAGITMNPGQNTGFDAFGKGMITAYPYSDTGFWSGTGSVYGQTGGANAATQLAVIAIEAAAQDPGPINVFTFSGGAQAFAAALLILPADVASRINNITYVSPGSVGGGLPSASSPVTSGTGNTTVVVGTSGPFNSLFNGFLGGNLPYGARCNGSRYPPA